MYDKLFKDMSVAQSDHLFFFLAFVKPFFYEKWHVFLTNFVTEVFLHSVEKQRYHFISLFYELSLFKINN